MTYTAAHGNAGSLTHCARPEIQPASLWILVGFLTPWAMTGISQQLFVCGLFMVPGKTVQVVLGTKRAGHAKTRVLEQPCHWLATWRTRILKTYFEIIIEINQWDLVKLKSFCTARKSLKTKQNKKTTHRMEENLCKRCNRQEPNLQNTQTTHTTLKRKRGEKKDMYTEILNMAKGYPPLTALCACTQNMKVYVREGNLLFKGSLCRIHSLNHPEYFLHLWLNRLTLNYHLPKICSF